MKPVWDDVNARARGLGTHLLTAAQLESLAREADITCLATALRHHGLIPGVVVDTPRPEDLELALRRWAAGLLRTLARWTGARAAALPLVFDDEDRRSVRAILRGAAQRAPVDRRLAGLIPTPSLPERALEELAAAPGIAGAEALLAAWHHPYAEALAPVASAAQPDLFAIEMVLSRAYGQRASAAARRGNSRAVRSFVRETIDLDNGITAIVLASVGRDVVASDVFLGGGSRISLETFEQAITTRVPVAAGARIAAALGRSPYAPAFVRYAGDPAALDDDLLRRRLRDLTRRVRQAPLDALSAIWFGLRLRAQLVDLQHIIWTVALDAPRQWLIGTLATAAA